MYFIWFLAAAGVLALGAALKTLVSRPQKRFLSPFQQSRPVPDLTNAAHPAERTSGYAGPGNPAGTDSAYRPMAAPSIVPPPIVPRPAKSPAGLSNDYTGSSWLQSSTIPMSATGVHNRISTWDNRRLFSNFRDILGAGTDRLPMPKPEDLPIAAEEFVFGSLTPAIAQLLPETESRRELQRKNLIGAGYHSRASWLNLAAIRFTLSFLALAIVGFWLIMAPVSLESWLVGLLVMAPLFMWAFPPLLVAFKAAERKIDIERGLPDVLDMMNMGVSQGLTVPQSLKRISREIAEAHPALSEELRIVTQQAEVGNLSQALRNFGHRIDSPEVNSFTSLLVQSESTGTSISRALTEYSDSIRASLKERADARANAASFKLLFPVALFLMPSVFLFLLGPAIVQMSDFFNNQAQQLQQDRRDALQSLDQQPQLDLQRLTAPGGQFSSQQ